MAPSVGRIRGAPEVRTKCDAEKAAAREARDMLAERLRPATAIELREVTRGKYFRLVAEVLADGVNLSALLLERGLARPYDGAVQGSARSCGDGGSRLA